MDTEKIPFNRPYVSGNELAYISQAINEFKQVQGDGHFTKRCHAFIEKQFGVKKALLTTSCTDALEMSALLLDLQPGDEVIVPSFTFVTSISAFVLRGAKPVFAEIRADTLNLDERKLAGLITKRTKAIVPVHYAGVGCAMDEIMALAKKHSLHVVEDSAQALFGKYKGKYLGTFGSLATQSFHETKNITCGEGGALLINDESLIERAEILREKGTNRSRFFRGQVDKYTWVDLGSSFLPSDLLAAFLLAQFENFEKIQSRRMKIWNAYAHGLSSWAKKSAVQLPFIPEHCEHPAHLFYLILPSLDSRTAFIEHLKNHGIQAVFHYQSLHLSDMGKKLGGDKYDLPITNLVSDQLVRLPLYNSLTDEQLERIISKVIEFKV